MNFTENIKLRKALKRVEELKGFYQHLIVFIIINLILFIIRGNVLEFFMNTSSDKNLVQWVDWNILIVPIFWGIGLVFHAAKVFQYKFGFIKKWEQKQLQKFIREEESKKFKN